MRAFRRLPVNVWVPGEFDADNLESAAAMLDELFRRSPTRETAAGTAGFLRGRTREKPGTVWWIVDAATRLSAALYEAAVEQRDYSLRLMVADFLRIAIDAVPEHVSVRTRLQYELAHELRLLNLIDGEVGARAAEIVAVATAAAAQPVPAGLSLSTLLAELSTAHQVLYRTTGRPDHVEAGVTAARRAVQALRDGDDAPGAHSALGLALLRLYEAEGDVGALRAALDAQRTASDLAAPENPNRPRFFANLAATITMLAQETGDLSGLDEAVDLGRAGVASASEDNPRRYLYLAQLGKAVAAVAARDRDPGGFDEGIAILRQAVSAVPEDSPDRDAVMYELYEAMSAAQEIGDADGARLAQTADMARSALAALAADTSPAGEQSYLGTAVEQMLVLMRIHARTGAKELMREAVSLGRDLLVRLDRRPADQDARPIIETRLANALAELGRAEDDRRLLDEAAELVVHAVNSASAAEIRSLVVRDAMETMRLIADTVGDAGPLDWTAQVLRSELADANPRPVEAAGYRLELALSLARRFSLTRDADTLAEFTAAVRDAVDAILAERFQDVLTANRCQVLLEALRELADDGDELGLLGWAAEVAAVIAALTPRDDPGYYLVLSDFVAAAETYLDHNVDREMESMALDAARAAVTVAPVNERARCWSRLAGALRRQFDSTGEVALLEEAAAMDRAALSHEPASLAHLSGLCTDLTLLARNRYPESLDEAIELGQRAVSSAQDNDPELGALLNVLGTAHQVRFEHTDDPTALAAASEAFRAAVAATAPGRDQHAGFGYNLCQSLLQQYRREGDSVVLAEAVELGRQVSAGTAEGHPQYTNRLSALAGALYEQYKRNGEPGVLEECAQVHERVLAGHEETESSYAAALGIHAAILNSLFELAGDPEVLADALALQEEAVDRTSADHPRRALRLTNLATLLIRAVSQASVATRDALFDRAIRVAKEAVEATAADHPARTHRLYALGRAAALSALDLEPGPGRFTELLRTAVDALDMAARHAHAPAADRMRAYALLLGLGAERAFDYLDDAVALFPQLADRALSLEDRTFHLAARRASLAESFADTALWRAGPRRAVEVLEQTRGILVADRLHLSDPDLTRLELEYPELAREFRAILARLDILERDLSEDVDDPDGADDSEALAPRRADLRRTVLAEYERVLSGIRAHEEFRDFLSPAFDRLVGRAGAGPVVYVFMGVRHGQAIVVDAHRDPQALHIPLERLTGDDLERHVRTLLGAVTDTTTEDAAPIARIRAQQRIHEVLAWMWDSIAETVLNALGFGEALAPGGTPRRIWWCPVGLLGFLPLHAAGVHADAGSTDPAVRARPRTVLDRVVSSYTPTLRGLGLTEAAPTDSGPRGTVVVAVPDAPGMPLPGALAEAGAIAEIVPGARVLDDPVRATVAAALPEFLVAHFACHGVTNAIDPASSRLVLRDHEERPLTVTFLSKQRLRAGLAYLSACETAVTNLELVDEAVHLSGALYLAGYRHVIGTLWPIGEFASKQVACDVHHALAADDQAPAIGDSALALHSAVRRLRDAYPNTPSAWAAYTHTGP
ncbi:CHAT domain-containing protein [Nocardia lijiangensis]|uniref:CHAT domain-containing protein n=1 Tax=Nocardia lijiangensis TaxID=299618 RepID=UPI00083096C5|nr:CHAT domain-containing protein [Nocardia lijiangensis]